MPTELEIRDEMALLRHCNPHFTNSELVELCYHRFAPRVRGRQAHKALAEICDRISKEN
jgi:hypothetical protein